MGFSDALGSPIDVDVAILTALPIEEAAVVAALGDCSVHLWRGHHLRIGDINGLRVLVFPIGGMGNASAAQAVSRVIDIWNPAHVLLAGIAGGAGRDGDDLYLGDVLVPDQVVGYELAKVRPQGVERRYEVYRPDWGLLTAARAVEPAEWALRVVTSRPDNQAGRIIPRARFGPILAGEKVIADEQTVKDLRRAWPKAIGIEMEGLGVGVASYRGGPGFLVTKAVCDFADSAKNDEWQPYAAEAAARFAVAVLRRAPLRPKTGRRQALPLNGPVTFSGRVKLYVTRRLHDCWEDVADIFNVPPHTKAMFERGNEPRKLWEWLDARSKLYVLPEVLSEIDRDDLAEFHADFRVVTPSVAVRLEFFERLGDSWRDLSDAVEIPQRAIRSFPDRPRAPRDLAVARRAGPARRSPGCAERHRQTGLSETAGRLTGGPTQIAAAVLNQTTLIEERTIPDDRTLFSIGSDQSVRAWDIVERSALAVFDAETPLHGLALAEPDLVVVGTTRGTIIPLSLERGGRS